MWHAMETWLVRVVGWDFLPSSIRLLIAVTLGSSFLLRFGLVVVDSWVLGFFDVFHELDCLVDWILEGIKTLSIHLSLPCFGSTKEEDVDYLVARQRVVHTGGICGSSSRLIR